MKYMVTGAAGFIGGHIARALSAQGHSVLGIDIKPYAADIPFEGVICNIEDRAAMIRNAKGCDGIFHMAAIASVPKTFDDPEGSYQTNVIGAQHVFEAASIANSAPIPVVYASSAAVYGDNDALPLQESETPKPMSPYAEQKLQNEKDAKRFGVEKSLPSFGLRFFNIYGPGQDPSSAYSGVISVFHDRLKNNKPITIFGDGGQTRDFVYVGDTVRACFAAMQCASDQAQVANICKGKTITILELLSLLANIMGKDIQPSFAAARAGDIRYSCGDSALIKKITGFSVNISMEEGLRGLIANTISYQGKT